MPAGLAAQETDPPCPAGASPSATIRAQDFEDFERAPFTATHTIVPALTTADGDEPDISSIEVPPGVQVVRAGNTPAFRTDTPGPVPVTVKWSHFSTQLGTSCTASASTTFAIEPARPLRHRAPRARGLGVSELTWFVFIGKNADRRPVQMRVRGARRARPPRPSLPVTTTTLGLRAGDGAREGRTLRSAGFRISARYFERDDLFRITMRSRSRPRRFGVELDLQQAGRRIVRTRVVGHCVRYNICFYRQVR